MKEETKSEEKKEDKSSAKKTSKNGLTGSKGNKTVVNSGKVNTESSNQGNSNTTNPSDPTNPTNPTGPTNPSDPTNPTDPTGPTNPSDLTIQEFVQQGLKFSQQFLNDLRLKNGRQVTTENSILKKAAYENAKNLATIHKTLTHVDDNKFVENKYTLPAVYDTKTNEKGEVIKVRKLTLAEPYAQANLYWNKMTTSDFYKRFSTPEEFGNSLINEWYADIHNKKIGSRGHRLAMLEPRFEDVGTGVYVTENNGSVEIYAAQYYGLTKLTELENAKTSGEIPDGDPFNPYPTYSPDGYSEYLVNEVNYANEQLNSGKSLDSNAMDMHNRVINQVQKLQAEEQAFQSQLP